VILPIIARTRVAACSNSLVVNYSGWDSDLWQVGAWYREA
jgi:peptide/nickel transport system substrate-binding protein